MAKYVDTLTINSFGFVEHLIKKNKKKTCFYSSGKAFHQMVAHGMQGFEGVLPHQNYYFMDCIQGHCHNSSQTRLLEGGVNILLAMLCTLTMRESEIFSSYLSSITLPQYHIWFSTIPDLSLLKNLLNLHIHNTKTHY